MFDRIEHVAPGGPGTPQWQPGGVLRQQCGDDLLEPPHRLHQRSFTAESRPQPCRRGERGGVDGDLAAAIHAVTLASPRAMTRSVAMRHRADGRRVPRRKEGRGRSGRGGGAITTVVRSVPTVTVMAIHSVARLDVAHRRHHGDGLAVRRPLRGPGSGLGRRRGPHRLRPGSRSRDKRRLATGTVPRPAPAGRVEMQDRRRRRPDVPGRHDWRRGTPPQRAGSRQLTPQPGPLLGRRLTALVELDECHAGQSVEDPAHQAGEHARRTDLHERPYAPGMELPDDVDPAYAFGHLPDEARADRRGIDQRLHGGAADDRQTWRGHRQAGEHAGKTIGRGGEQRGVERARHRQSLGAESQRLQRPFHHVHTGDRTADDELLGGVLGTDPHRAGERRHQLADARHVTNDREHRPTARPLLLNRIGPGTRGAGAVFRAPRPSRGKRRELAETVAGDDVGGEAHAFEHPPGEQVAEVHRPLGVPHTQTQGMVGAPGGFRQRRLTHAARQRVETGGHLGGHRRLGHQTAEHVAVLRPLPREDRGHEGSDTGGRPDGRRGFSTRRDAGRQHRRRHQRLGGRWRRRGWPNGGLRHREAVVHHEVADERPVGGGHRTSTVPDLVRRRNRPGAWGRDDSRGDARALRHARSGGQDAAGQGPRHLEDSGGAGGRSAVADEGIE